MSQVAWPLLTCFVRAGSRRRRPGEEGGGGEAGDALAGGAPLHH